MFVAVIVWKNWLLNRYDIPVKATVRLGIIACLECMGSRFVGERGPVEEAGEKG
jgi:hypothetical protein